MNFDKVAHADQYNAYLKQHIANVKQGFNWMKENLPEVLNEYNYIEETQYYGELEEIIDSHDFSKYTNIPDVDKYYELTVEYQPYAEYFYGTKTPEVREAFDKAWLAHIHANPHHWQHWILHNDTDGVKILDMPYVFIIEMICDHWAFSWRNNNLYEIFDWYNQNKEHIMFSERTRTTYENILSKLRDKLDELQN